MKEHKLEETRRREVYELLDNINNLKTRAERVKALAELQESAVNDLLLLTFHPNINLGLPQAQPPYMPCDEHNAPSSLHRESKNFKMLVAGQSTGVSKIRKEKVFLGILESVHPKDAELMSEIVMGRWPYKKIDEKVVREAKPNLLPKVDA